MLYDSSKFFCVQNLHYFEVDSCPNYHNSFEGGYRHAFIILKWIVLKVDSFGGGYSILKWIVLKVDTDTHSKPLPCTHLTGGLLPDADTRGVFHGV